MPKEIDVFCEYRAFGPRSTQGRGVEGCDTSISGVRVGKKTRVGTAMCPTHALRLPWDKIPDDALTVCEGDTNHLTSVKFPDRGRKCLVSTSGGGIHSILEKRSEQPNMDTESWLSARRSAQTSNAGPSQQPMVAQPDQYAGTGWPEGPGEAQSDAPSYPLPTTGSAFEQGTNGEYDPSQHQLPSFQAFMTGTFGPDPDRWAESR